MLQNVSLCFQVAVGIVLEGLDCPALPPEPCQGPGLALLPVGSFLEACLEFCTSQQSEGGFKVQMAVGLCTLCEFRSRIWYSLTQCK